MKFLLALVLLVAAFSGAAAQSDRSLVREGNRQYKDNKFSDAEVNYRKALEKNKDLTVTPFNLGDALYRQGRFGEAAEQYQISASKGTNAVTKAQSLHNLGNSLIKQQKYPESIAAYKEALKLKPDDEDTKYNLEYAKAMLKQQQQQQNKDQKKDDKQKKDQDKKDQQKQNDQQKNDQQKQDQQKQDEQKQDQQKQDQQNKEDQKKAQQMKKMQISKEDAERILEALKNEEKQVQKKLHKKAPARVKVDKDW